MNFYEYHQVGEDLAAPAVYLAAKDLLLNGFQVIPLKKGSKEPNNIRSVYDIISKPIHEKTFDWHFKDKEVDLGIIMDHNMEFIDVDPKNKPGVAQQFLKALESGWPELYEKLVIDFTPSGGCHIIYRSEVNGGKSALAKVHAKPNPVAIIERISRHNKQYIKISPSDGYRLFQRNPFEIPFLSAEERNWISAIAASFNEVVIPEVKKKESEREDSPWKIFNDTHDWKYIRNELIDRAWSIYREDSERVYLKRPGDTNQKYSGTIFKQSNILYLFTPSTEFKNEKGYTPFGVYAILYHGDDPGSAMRQLASEGCGKNIYDEGQFWVRVKGKIEIRYTELLNWLHSVGYRTYNNTIVQIINNVVEIVDESSMKRAFINEVEFEIKDRMFERVSSIFSPDGGIMAMLNELEDKFIWDDKNSTWLFFSNLAIEVTAKEYILHEYSKLTGYIWKSSIIDREFYQHDFASCDADKFIEILGGDNDNSLREIIGYSISRYKDALNPRAVILMEDIDSEDEGESQGGSGKGLCFQFVKQFRKSCDLDGKSFKPSEQFAFQNVDHDTDIIYIDDVERGFKFSSLFSIITGPLPVNKKNRDQILIPFSRSAKIFITSNYSIGGMDISSRRRKYEFPVVKYFGEDIEPVDVFKRQFFSEWDKTEWLRFDNLIADCCQRYLNDSNKKSIATTTVHSAERSLISNTNRDFVEYMDAQLSINFFDFAPLIFKTKTVTYPDGSITTNAVNMDMYDPAEKNPDYYFVLTKEALFANVRQRVNSKYFTTTKLTHWLRRWAEFRAVEVDTSYKRQSQGERGYRLISWPDQKSSFPLVPKDDSGNEWHPNSEW